MLGLRCLSPLEVEYWHRKRYFVWISGHFWFKYPSINCLILQGWHGKHISTLYVFLMKSIMPTMNMIWPCLVLVFLGLTLRLLFFHRSPPFFLPGQMPWSFCKLSLAPNFFGLYQHRCGTPIGFPFGT